MPMTAILSAMSATCLLNALGPRLPPADWAILYRAGKACGSADFAGALNAGGVTTLGRGRAKSVTRAGRG